HRFPKAYRHPSLDALLTKKRTQGEVKGCARARRLGVLTPPVLYSSSSSGVIVFPLIGPVQGGCTLREYLEGAFREGTGYGEEGKGAVRDMCRMIIKMHEGGMCHGDLTTSNFMVTDGPLAAVPAGGEGGKR
ncbi:hypothetical protein TrRE_jg8563, partial [Triparma retinervis]